MFISVLDDNNSPTSVKVGLGEEEEEEEDFGLIISVSPKI